MFGESKCKVVTPDEEECIKEFGKMQMSSSGVRDDKMMI
jgi:hypothetical protein